MAGDPLQLELRQLRYFLSLIRTLNFARAAAEHGVTQQALSRAIQKLEETLGVRLFERDTRRVEPTMFGELLSRYAASAEAEVRGFGQALDALLGRGTDRLTVGIGPAGAGDLATRAILETLRRRPRLRLTVRTGRYDTLMPGLLRGELDLIVAVMTTDDLDPLIAHEPIAEEPYRVVAAANHPLAGRPLRLGDLAGHAWLEGLGMGAVLERARRDLEAAGVALPDPSVRTDSMHFVRKALAESQLLAVLPLHTVGMEIDAGLLTALDLPEAEGWRRPLAVFWRERGTRSPDALALIATLRGLAGRGAGQPVVSSSTSS